MNTGNKKELNIVLKEDTETLDEVVVVGYGVQKKANLTGAVSSVKTVSYTHLDVYKRQPLQVDGTKISIPEYWQAWDIRKLKPADALNKGKKRCV